MIVRNVRGLQELLIAHDVICPFGRRVAATAAAALLDVLLRVCSSQGRLTDAMAKTSTPAPRYGEDRRVITTVSDRRHAAAVCWSTNQPSDV